MKPIKKLLRSLKSLAGPFPDFHLDDLPDNPSELFVQWFNAAVEEGVSEPHAMTLSTVDEQGAPDARVLILKDVTCTGWYFATSSASQKGEQLKRNSKVALTFYWTEMGRQVRIRGSASIVTAEESSKDFLERSIQARAIASIGKQSEKLINLKDLEKELSDKQKLIKESSQYVSPNWKLFVVVADEVEFWQGDPERKHKRVLYQRIGEIWEYQLLWP